MADNTAPRGWHLVLAVFLIAVIGTLIIREGDKKFNN